MVDWLVRWGVKKWVLSALNKALAAYNVNIDRSRAIVAAYAGKVKALLAFLESLDAKIADAKLTEEEAEELTAEAKALGKALVS